jgi:hypothetical protein
MTKCGACGTENDADSNFCKSCGAAVVTSQPAEEPSSPPPPQGEFERNMAEMGKRIGEDFRRAGERFGQEMGRRGSEFGRWWDHTLGIFSPVIIGMFGVVGFFIVILFAGAISTISDHPAFWDDLVAFLERYWWLFIGLAFFSAFQGYFMRRYRWTFMWINPLLNGVGFVACFWILAQVLQLLSVDADHPRLGDLSDFIEDMLIVIFFLVVFFGYLLAFFRSVSPSNWDKRRTA